MLMRGARETAEDGGGVVRLHPPAPLVAKEGTRAAPGDRLVQRLLGPGVEHDVGGLVALADDLQRGLVAGPAEVGDVGVARFGHTESVESEQARQGVGVAALVLRCGEKIGQLVAVEPGLGAGVALRAADARGGVADGEIFVLKPPKHELSVAMRRYSVAFAGCGCCASSWRR